MWLIRNRKNCLLLNPGSHKGRRERSKSHRHLGLSALHITLPAREVVWDWEKASADEVSACLPPWGLPAALAEAGCSLLAYGMRVSYCRGPWTASSVEHILLVCCDYSLSSESLRDPGDFLEVSFHLCGEKERGCEAVEGPEMMWPFISLLWMAVQQAAPCFTMV